MSVNNLRRQPDTVIAHNSLKHYPSATWLQYVQLGVVSIILVKFHEIPTNGCREIVYTRNVYRTTDRPTDRATVIKPTFTSYLAGDVFIKSDLAKGQYFHKYRQWVQVFVTPRKYNH